MPPKVRKESEKQTKRFGKVAKELAEGEERLSASCHFLRQPPEPPALKLAKKEMPLSLFRRAHTSLPMKTGLSQFGCIYKRTN
ncbi:hypothetical protein [Bacteroides sp. An269]|uniref:hypothetical protein n=1 Tax=Bacteroides sp. An269 TaxID=1965613 RepID=UPI00130268C0|nr:hypothetical protein [Bacteroides sp. An269]